MGLADLLFQSAAVGAGAFFVGTAPLWFTSIASGTFPFPPVSGPS